MGGWPHVGHSLCFMSYEEMRFIRNFLGAKCPVGWVFSPFYLILNTTHISVPVQFNSHAKHCNRPRKALHPPTQSFASANAKLCICSRKALQLSAQCIACGITIIWSSKTMDAKEKVLSTMKEAGQPINAGRIAELSGLDRKDKLQEYQIAYRRWTITEYILSLQDVNKEQIL